MTLSPPDALLAILFASSEPLSKKQLAEVLGIGEKELEKVTTALRESLKGGGLSLIEAPEGYELRTSADASAFIKKLREGELTRDLGRAGLETLAIVLYQGGAVRSEIDWIRGVNSTTTLRSLLLRGLVERVEDERDKRRPRYRVTADALAHLGLASPEEAPNFAELQSALTDAEEKKEIPTELAT